MYLQGAMNLLPPWYSLVVDMVGGGGGDRVVFYVAKELTLARAQQPPRAGTDWEQLNF